MHDRQRQPWTDADDQKLLTLHAEQAPLPEMVAALGRSGEAIDRRLAVHNLSRTGRKRTKATV
jgi:hypothetical protein